MLLLLERLEDRMLFASPGVLLSNRGTLLIQLADEGENGVRLRRVGGSMQVTIASQTSLTAPPALPTGRGEVSILPATFDTRNGVLTQDFVLDARRFSVVRIEGGDLADHVRLSGRP